MFSTVIRVQTFKPGSVNLTVVLREVHYEVMRVRLVN